ncbi:MAG: class I SAM-dependent methyltransferase [Nannocystaceae bacterium]|nr:class I SAM-dependent methyltransferase [Nannocystaceae bacterium]
MTSYDEVPYTSYSYPQAHADRLHVVASLFGACPAPVDGARVLELGCASGGNLLSAAELLPGSEFIGLDSSLGQLEVGRELAAEIELPNLELRHADIMDVDETWGMFDFIICHGVYSWVPPPVQDKILSIFRDRLRPQGVGYISYNVYPGWHLREMVRRMMRYHVREVEDPGTRVVQASALIDFLSQNVSDTDGAYGVALRKELALLQTLPSDYLYHEHLEEQNQPIYFHEFADRLDARGLQYVGETDLRTMIVADLASEAAQTLQRIAPDLYAMEQYTDFLHNRQFRASVICHRDITLKRELRPPAADGLCFEFPGSLGEGPIDLAPEVNHTFIGPGEVRMNTASPITKAALVHLRQAWPLALGVDELFGRASSLLAEAGIEVRPSDRDGLATDLLGCCFGGGLGVRSWVPPLATTVHERPRVTRTARAQAKRADFVAGLHHQVVRLDRAQRHVVQRLDGERDRQQLGDELTQLVLDGELDLTRDGTAILDRDALREPLAHVLEQTLAAMLGQAMLLEPSSG